MPSPPFSTFPPQRTLPACEWRLDIFPEGDLQISPGLTPSVTLGCSFIFIPIPNGDEQNQRLVCSPSGKGSFCQSLPRVARHDFRRAGNPGLTCPSKQALRMVIVKDAKRLFTSFGCLESLTCLDQASITPD